MNKSATKGRSSSITTRSASQWLLAAAAILILSLCAYLIFQNLNLHNQIQQMQTEKESLRTQEQELQKQIAQLKHQSGGTKPDKVMVLAFALMPQTRGIIKIPKFPVPAAIDYIELTLKFETNEFPKYQAVLKDPVTDQMVWKSADLEPDKSATSVQVRIPRSLFEPQNYLMELSGFSANGTAEIVNTYPFTITLP